MQITFLRHGRLMPPYKDYKKLSLDELSNLSLQKIDPSIDVSDAKKRILASDLLKNDFDVIFMSSAKRAKQTAQIMANALNINDIKISDLVKEITFDPKKLVTSQQYENEGLNCVRHGLFEALENNTNIEQISSIITRLDNFKSLLKKGNYQSVLVVTHGFLLRVIDLYMRQSTKNITAQLLNQSTNYDYLDGFSVFLN